MQSGRFILAVILMIAVVVITNVLFPPVPRTDKAAARDSVTQAQTPATTQAPAGAAVQPATDAPVQPQAQHLRADTVIIESGLYRYGVSTVGAGIVSAEMLPWKSYTREGPVQQAARCARPAQLPRPDRPATGRSRDPAIHALGASAALE
jgi:YidC/Oxa1 family membrane protein insertase